MTAQGNGFGFEHRHGGWRDSKAASGCVMSRTKIGGAILGTKITINNLRRIKRVVLTKEGNQSHYYHNNKQEKEITSGVSDVSEKFKFESITSRRELCYWAYRGRTSWA